MSENNICFSVTFRGSPSGVRRALRMTRAEIAASGASADMLGRVETVLAEVLNNVVEHALRDRPGEMVKASGHQKPDGWHFRINDTGCALPDGELPGSAFPKLDTAIEDLPEGGFGWAMVHLLTRDLHYCRLPGRNCLSFRIPFE